VRLRSRVAIGSGRPAPQREACEVGVCRQFVELNPVTFCGANHIIGPRRSSRPNEFVYESSVRTHPPRRRSTISRRAAIHLGERRSRPPAPPKARGRSRPLRQTWGCRRRSRGTPRSAHARWPQLALPLFVEAFDGAPQETGALSVSACRRDGGATGKGVRREWSCTTGLRRATDRLSAWGQLVRHHPQVSWIDPPRRARARLSGRPSSPRAPAGRTRRCRGRTSSSR
jgi:hypothetical protein